MRILKLLSFMTALTVGLFFCVPTEALPMAPPSVSAHGALLMNADNGAVYFEKNADKRMGPASTTKLMTALVVLSLCSPTDRFTIPPEAVGIEGSSIYLVAGETLSVEELLYALLLSSANDAATALAIGTCGSVESFCAQMNAKADELGLENTHFSNPHGLSDDEHYTTARDLAKIARAVLSNDLLSEIVATYKHTIPFSGEPDRRLLVNHNKLLRSYDGAIGMKTGFTKKTGRTLVSAAERDGMTLIAVTLNAPDDWRDHAAMLDYGFSTYERVVFFAPHAFTFSQPVTGGTLDAVTLWNENELSLYLPKERSRERVTVTTRTRFSFAPVEAGASIGSVSISCEGQTVHAPLITSTTISEKSPQKEGFFDRIFHFFHFFRVE